MLMRKLTLAGPKFQRRELLEQHRSGKGFRGLTLDFNLVTGEKVE